MSQPGYLAVAGGEVANNARTAAYMAAGLGGAQFEVDSSGLCPALTEMAFPLAVCDDLAASTDNQLYSDPLPSYRIASTGVAPTSAVARWREAGWFGWAASAGSGPSGALVLPDTGSVEQRVRVWLDVLTAAPSGARTLHVLKVVGAGTANAGWIGVGVSFSGGVWTLDAAGRTPTGVNYSLLTAPATGLVVPTLTVPVPTDWVLEVAWTAQGFTARLYGGDPDTGSALIASVSYGFATFTGGSSWFAATGQTEAQAFAAATEVALGSGNAFVFASTEMVVTEVAQLVGVACVATGTSYPSASEWPSPLVYPGLYGTFVNPGVDHAPWYDAAVPASGDFLGLLITRMDGLDTTETRSMSGNATGIGGILGPQVLNARDVQVEGYVIASSPAGMQYARRWLAEALAGALCPGCEGDYLDVLLTCNGDAADLWRIYDAGLTSLVFDLSDAESCDYVTPVTFTIGAADPFLYKLPEVVVAETLLNPDGSDAVEVPFEEWLFGSETPVCIDLADPLVGIDAPVFVFDGGASGIESAVVYRTVGHYPGSSVFPGDCVYPAVGTPQWDMSVCPFSFMLSIGPGEVFVLDNSRRRLDWYLADGTALNGAQQLNLQAGQTIQWIDTCDGEALEACAVAFAGCTCDDTASVTIYSQHRER